MQPRPPILTFQSCPWDNPQNCPLFICNKHRKNCECCPVSLLISCHNECHEFKFKSDFWDPIAPWLRVGVWDHKPTSNLRDLVQFDSINWSSHLVMVAERSLSFHCHQHNTDSRRVQSLFGQCPEQGTQFPPKNTQSIATHPIAHRWANCAEKWLSIKYRVIKIKCYWLKIRAWTLLQHYFH